MLVFEVDAWGRRRGGCRLGGCHVYRWTPLAVPVALRSRLAKGLDAELLWHVWKSMEKMGNFEGKKWWAGIFGDTDDTNAVSWQYLIKQNLYVLLHLGIYIYMYLCIYVYMYIYVYICIK